MARRRALAALAVLASACTRGPGGLVDLCAAAALDTSFPTGALQISRRRAAGLTGDRDLTGSLGASPGNVSSFGEDGCGEPYAVSYGGAIHRLVPGP
jgi:hypothetical protein